jgi:hypothetical protein
MIHFILQADYIGSERALLYYYFSIFLWHFKSGGLPPRFWNNVMW